MSRGARTRPSTLVGAWVGNGLVTNLGDFESIATETVGSGGTSLITFSSIPQTYKHLQLRCLARTNRALVSDNLTIRFNGVSSAAYTEHLLNADPGGLGITAYGSSSFTTAIFVSNMAGGNASANVFGAGFIDILDYTNTNKNKTIRDLSGIDSNGSGVVGIGSSFWSDTSAITSITIAPRIGTSLSQYSHFALYGIKG